MSNLHRSAVPFLTGVLAASCLTVGGLGVAVASNGGSLTLGHTNQATSTTTLTDHRGTPLSLVGRKSKPPLIVNSSKQVKRLNASLLDGKNAASLATSGSGATTIPAASAIEISTSLHLSTMLARTAQLTPGTYFVSAYAWVRGGGTDGIGCFIGPTTDTDDLIAQGSADTGDWMTIPQSALIRVTKAEKLDESCFSGPAGGLAYGASITAIRVAHATTGTTYKVLK